MNKKGSLELSIQTIVIVVIAFIVLGLGLGFVRNVFKDIGDTTRTIQEDVKQKIIDDLRTGDKKLSFPASELTIGKKESKVTAVGVKNTNQGTLTYKLVIEQKGGDSIFGTEISDNFLYLTEEDQLTPTETRIIPIRITSETAAGTGQFKIMIQDVTAGDEGAPYDSKTFFITVTG